MTWFGHILPFDGTYLFWPPLSCRHQSRPFLSSSGLHSGSSQNCRCRAGSSRQTWLRTICTRSISAWRWQSSTLCIDWHGVNSWRQQCLHYMLRRQREGGEKVIPILSILTEQTKTLHVILDTTPPGFYRASSPSSSPVSIIGRLRGARAMPPRRHTLPFALLNYTLCFEKSSPFLFPL